jgi:hypothetical protein
MEEEEPLERQVRHGMEQRTQFDILRQVSDMRTQFDALTKVVTKQGETLDEVRGWLVGTAEKSGTPAVGLLVAVAELNESRKWIVGLAKAAVAGIFINALMTFLHYAGVLK